MQSNYVFFRADGNDSIGHGHISRMISICERLEKVSNTKFILLDSDLKVIAKLRRKGFDYLKYSSENQFINSIKKGDIIILDGYNFNQEYIESIKSKFAKIIFIDDLNSQPLNVDMIINHSNYYTALDYKCNNDTHIFIGDKYSMIGTEFLNYRKPRKIKNLKNIVLCLGMSKNGELLNNVLKSTLNVFSNAKINVVSGYNQVKVESTDCQLVDHKLLDEDNMINLFDNVDIAILPVSTLYMEASARNTIIIAGYFTHDQKKIYSSVITKENIFGIGDFNHFDISNLKKVKNKIEQQLPRIVKNDIGEGWDEIKKIIFSWIKKE